MLDSIIFFSIKNKLIIGLFVLALVGWGVWSATKLPIDAVPDITNNQVQIITTSPSLAAQEVERLITFPIELSMANIPGLVEIRSISRFGLSVVTVVFDDETDVYLARQHVNERLPGAGSQIPPGVGTPEMAPVSTGLGEIYQYILRPAPGFENSYSATELRTLQDWVVKRQLTGIAGVADVSSFGGYVKQYEVAINPDKLRSMDVTLSEVFSALEKNNQNTGGAYIEKEPNAWFIRTEGLVESLDEIRNISVKNTGTGAPITINDVAEVNYGHAIRYGAMTVNNEGETVGGIVLMLKGENSNRVIKNVKSRIEQIQKTLPEGVVLEAYLDRTKLVNKAIHTVSANLAEGALIVVFVLVLFLGNMRAGLVVASVIPLAMLFALAMMNLFGVSGNLMSLGAIDFGLIVDGAVIIVEATLHHIAGKKYMHRLSQQEMDKEVFDSASKIRNSAAFGEIIILVVYLPILALTGIEGKMFAPMAQTVVFAIMGAFILSLTYVPMISSLLLSKNAGHKRTFSDRMMGFLERAYLPVIAWAVRQKATVIGLATILFACSLVLFSQMGGEFIPSLDEGDFAVETRVLTGSSMNQTIDAALKAGKILKEKFPEVKKVIGKIGTSEIPTDPMPIEACDLMIILKDKNEWRKGMSKDELADKMKQALEEIPGVTFGFQQPIQMRFNELMTGARQDVAIKIYGENLDSLSSLAQKLGKVIQPVEGVKDLYIENVTGLPQIVVNFDRAKAARYGISIEEMNRTVRTAFAGESAGWVYEGEKRFDLVVRLQEAYRAGPENIKNLYVTTARGTQVPLTQVAEVDFKLGPNQIQRDDTKRRIIVAFNVRERDVESIVNEIKQRVDEKMKLPTGYYLTFGGQFKNLEEAKSRLMVAVPLALGLIFVLLYFTFRSLKQSLLIFTAIPLSAIGGILALWLRQMPFSISAGVGFIALFGVAVLNGIVLIGEFNRLKKSGVIDMKEIIFTGTQTRLRPVLMTAMVASLGFLPMALSNGAGAEVQKPLATVVIGGLITATLLTLLVLPVLYIFSERGFGKTNNIPLSPPLIILALILFSSTVTYAQTPKELSVDEAVNLALKNNGSIKAAEYRVEYSRYMKNTATDIGKTSATLMYGQFNSYYNDNSLTISQSLPFPVTMHRQGQLYGAETKSAELNKEITENDLRFQVKTAFLMLQYALGKQQLLLRQDSIYTQFLKTAELRHKTGESNLLEKATAESQLYEIRTRTMQNEADIAIHKTWLQTLLNSDEEYTCKNPEMPIPDLLPEAAFNIPETNPNVKYGEQQVQLADAGIRLEKSKLLPDLTVGYFSQTLYGVPHYQNPGEVSGSNDRFGGVSVGLSFPLWIKPQTARIRAGETAKNSAEASYQQQQKELEGQYRQAWQEYMKFKNSFEYYKNSALPTAKIITETARANYRSGNIDYLELSQGLNNALNIENNYLLVLCQYNLALIKIEYLSGN